MGSTKPSRMSRRRSFDNCRRRLPSARYIRPNPSLLRCSGCQPDRQRSSHFPVSNARLKLPLKFFRPAEASAEARSMVRVCPGSIVNCGSWKEFAAPPCIHHKVGVIDIEAVETLRSTEYGVNIVPAGNRIIGSAGPTIRPTSAIPKGAFTWDIGGAGRTRGENLKFAE